MSVNGNQSCPPTPHLKGNKRDPVIDLWKKKNIQTLEKTFTSFSEVQDGQEEHIKDFLRRRKITELRTKETFCQQHFRVTEEEAFLLSSSTPLHLPQQEVQCANHPPLPPPALSDRTPSHVTHLMCLRHTMQMSNLRLDNHTLLSLLTVQAITTSNISCCSRSSFLLS